MIHVRSTDGADLRPTPLPREAFLWHGEDHRAIIPNEANFMRRLHSVLGSIAFLTATSATFATGCDEAAAPLPQGAWSVTFVSAGGTCNINSHNAAVGEVNDSTAAKLVQEGQNSADVSCSVLPSTGGFKVEANALLGGASLTMTIGEISKDASVTAPATGSIAFISTQTQNVYQSVKQPCNFYFVDPAEGVSAGAIWVGFDCPSIEYQDHECGIATGFAKFVNCDGAVNSD